MISPRVAILFVLALVCGGLLNDVEAFAPVKNSVQSTTTRNPTFVNVFKKKKQGGDDLSYIESRDMTKEEMFALNQQNEDIMNMELVMMTGFSLVISLPILYLCWVAYFSE
eukprot:CAMPEP_0118687832 /NCGR_PEP_ID=MMETSP0800-20121206/8596_1 /TAXON_ID=210618 ORGANISM="Striatella unipunctata, Strain CCMP2910" /NCGR_SAMPLE_ID=MMETSP0800 /ASSEMBLY_ACC=CAM_ASM_000638 /LENGTH=110 /DNA_ID=CAMNT_0006585049 /DNA_START=83 /DNA_END=415 /DNA_ORIENTATION=-